MPNKTVPLTREGKEKLEEELEELYAQRADIAQRIHDAQEMGTSQNDAEYDDAKAEQSMLEGRITERLDILRRAVIIDEASVAGAGRVVVGSRIEVDQGGKTMKYHIVGGPEADPPRGKISNESPVGLALLGKQVGDQVEVNVPRGVVKLKVLKID
jgi:transcription elongation factor GreA